MMTVDELNDVKDSYEDEQKQFKKDMVELSEKIQSNLDDLDFDSAVENMEKLSDKQSEAKQAENEFFQAVRETVNNILPRKRTTLDEQYTIRDGGFYPYRSSSEIYHSKTFDVLKELKKKHVNGDEDRWKAIQSIGEVCSTVDERWEGHNFKSEREVEMEKPEDHVLDISSYGKEKIKDVDKVSISGSRFSRFRFKKDGYNQRSIRLSSASDLSMEQVFLLANARKQIHEMQVEQLKELEKKKEELEAAKDEVESTGKSFNVADKISKM